MYRNDLVTIRIKNLRLRTFIGINDDEVRNRQDVVINALVQYAASPSIRFDSIDEALNYRTLTKQVIAHVENNRFQLLERLTQEVLDLVMAYPAVRHAQVEIDKPHALRFADSVSIQLTADRI